MRIGILGGSFNPVHLGHMILAQSAFEGLKLDKLYFVPAYIAPLKSRRHLAAAEHRLAMLKLALAGHKDFRISVIELKRAGISYTVDTLRSFKKKNIKLFFITGADSLQALWRWKNVSQILKLATFVVAARPGFKAKRLRPPMRFIAIPQVDISSSMIRSRLKKNRTVCHLLDEKVLSYIRKRGLYR
jgi:nicotinate-nucleotide adenylyltransferase